MDRITLKALEEALLASPDNIVLRKQLALGYMVIEAYEEAKNHWNTIVVKEPSEENKHQLAKCFLALKNISAGLMICEELSSRQDNPDFFQTYLQLLIEDGQISDAIEQYQAFQLKNPDWENENLEKLLKTPSTDIAEDENVWNEFMEKPKTNFSMVGGMDDVKEEINIKIIQPLVNKDLYKAFGKKAGGGILMYGPPGCGKTFLSKATAGEISSKFMSIGLEDILDMWMGNSEKNLHEKFETARKNNPCVLFFDEIDALGSKRNDLKQSSSRNVINQFLKEMDGVDSDNDGVLILGATNSPWHIDSAFLRPGRFDRIIFIPPPDKEARIKILELILTDKPIGDINYTKIADKTKEFSGADLKALVEQAIEEKLRASMKSGKIEKIETKDLLNALKRVKPSTKEWFNTAKNYALYSNQSGLYDDIKAYLKL